MAVLDDLPVGRWLSTDDEAFESIYRTYRPALLAFCRSRLGGGDEAEDACQEALLRAYRAMPGFDRSQRLWPWLATIAANVCTDTKRRRRAVPLSACDDAPLEGVVDPQEELDARARRELVGAALRDIPERYRRQVYLADAEGWSYEEIASREHRSLASVRSSLMRGRVAFKARAQAMAEERGMWPLSAVLFPATRQRLLHWRASRHSEDLQAAASSSMVSVVQAATAALALLTTAVPGVFGVAAGAETVVAIGTPSAAVTPDRLEPSGAIPPAHPEQSGPSAKVAPLPAPNATTDIDLDGDERGLSADVTVGSEPEPDPAWWWWSKFACDGSVLFDKACETTDGLP